MFDNTDSLLDLIHAYRNDHDSGSLLDKYADESVHNQSSLYDVSPVDYSANTRDGFQTGSQSQLAEHSIQNVFNLRRENANQLGIINKMRGLQANRLDYDTDVISLGENYADKALDSRTMDGLYNVTLTDIYKDKTRFMAFHGLFTDGMVEIKSNTELDVDTKTKSDSFDGTMIGDHKYASFDNESLHKQQTTTSLYYQNNVGLYESTEQGPLIISSVASSMLGRLNNATDTGSTPTKNKDVRHDIVSNTNSVSAFDSAKDVDLVQLHKADSYTAAKAVDDKNNTNTSSILVKGDTFIEDPFDPRNDPSNTSQSETKNILNKDSNLEAQYDGVYDAKSMRPWIKEHELKTNIAKAIAVDGIEEYEGSKISDLILEEESELQDKIKKPESASSLTGIVAPERNYSIEEKGLELKSSLSTNSIVEKTEEISISSKILELENKYVFKKEENKTSIFGDEAPLINFNVEKQGSTLTSLLKEESEELIQRDVSITNQILETEKEIRNRVFKREEENVSDFTGGLIPKKNFDIEKQGSTLTSLLKDDTIETVAEVGLVSAILVDNSNMKKEFKKESKEKISIIPQRNYEVEKQGTQLGVLLQKDFETNNGVRFDETQYYDEKELEKKKTDLEIKMKPILEKMRKEEIKSLIVSFQDKLLYATFEEKLIIDLKIAIAKKFL